MTISARITRRITEAVTQPLTDSKLQAFANATKFPYIQINRAELADGIDTISATVFSTSRSIRSPMKTGASC